MNFKSKNLKGKNEYLNNIDNKNNNRNYKSLCIHFTKNEYSALSKIAKKENRSLINAIKTAILNYS
jgi:hypothetical protein